MKKLGLIILLAVAAITVAVLWVSIAIPPSQAPRQPNESSDNHCSPTDVAMECDDAVIEDSQIDEADEPEDDTEEDGVEENVQEGETEEEIRIAAWDAAVDRYYKAGVDYVPTAAEVRQFKTVFDRLTDEEKLEHIPEAQNLLSDNAFACLEAILMDVKEPEDVLSSIYHDLLNRPEELKNPILRKIAAEKDHPLAEEVKELLSDLEG